MLRLGGADVKISYLELFDNNIGPMGGLALGHALSFGHNLSLLTLKLDYNSSFGSQGSSALTFERISFYTIIYLLPCTCLHLIMFIQ